jgi:hypothetical protein
VVEGTANPAAEQDTLSQGRKKPRMATSAPTEPALLIQVRGRGGAKGGVTGGAVE